MPTGAAPPPHPPPSAPALPFSTTAQRRRSACTRPHARQIKADRMLGLSSCQILGVAIHDVTLDGALAAVDEFIASGRPHQVVTVNMDFLRLAQRDQRFCDALNQADLAVP